MKELNSNCRLAFGIDPSDVWPFITVAIETTQSQVFLGGWSVMLLGNDVIDLKRKPCEILGKMAILAPPLRS